MDRLSTRKHQSNLFRRLSGLVQLRIPTCLLRLLLSLHLLLTLPCQSIRTRFLHHRRLHHRLPLQICPLQVVPAILSPVIIDSSSS
jgi:hypothetical protein